MIVPADVRVVAVDWPEVTAGDDLVTLLIDSADLRDGDIVAMTSKVVSKAAGRVVTGEREPWVVDQTSRVVARRGETVIAQTAHGLVLAAAGVDASNTPNGTVVLLPLDADSDAARLRVRVAELTGRNVAVIITDTAGRAWREGQTDLAVGCAGLHPITDLRGTADSFGRRLEVTMPALADELAAAADLVKAKATGCPVAIVRGLADVVLPTGDSGPGAAALVRQPDFDLFGLGARDAVVTATLRTDAEALRHFPILGAGEDVPFEELSGAATAAVWLSVVRGGVGEERTWLVQVDVRSEAASADWLAAGRVIEGCTALATGHRLLGAASADAVSHGPGWETAHCTLWRIA
jgi:coenzyme F420-0:L-glutamate ligase/coenzyme F420-1:gamma-L-glutamate ligase